MTDLLAFTDEFRRALFDVLPCAVFVMNAERKVVYWNRSAEEMTGYSAEDMLGAPCEVLASRLSQAVDPHIAASLCPFADPPDAWDEQAEIQHRDGRRIPVVRKARPVHDAEGNLLGGIQTMMDITFIRQAQDQITRLRDQVARAGRYGRLVGSSPQMAKLFEAMELVAETDAAVVIEGETGTGKELIARTIHEQSRRRDKPFVPVNCGALPEGLIEAELFGHVRGAFTGATADRAGRFEDADGGTLFLDELAELPLAAQVKLLRAVQEQEFSRVGESKLRKVDVRILAATNRPLATEIAEGRFREDLYYRLRVVGLDVPALRERPDDIPELVGEFLSRLNRRYGRGVQRVTAEAMRALESFDWPGNVRQLQHALEHAYVVTPAVAEEIARDALPPEVLRANGRAAPRAAPPTPDQQRRQLQDALTAAGGNKAAAARRLGITRAGLYARMRRLNVEG